MNHVNIHELVIRTMDLPFLGLNSDKAAAVATPSATKKKHQNQILESLVAGSTSNLGKKVKRQ